MEPVGEHVADVLVSEAVVHDPTDLPALDDPAIPQQTQLVREGRLAASEQCCEVTHAELLGKRERVQQSRAGDVGEQLEGRGKLLGVRAGDHSAQEGPDVLRVEAFHLAPIGGQFHICTVMQIL